MGSAPNPRGLRQTSSGRRKPKKAGPREPRPPPVPRAQWSACTPCLPRTPRLGSIASHCESWPASALARWRPRPPHAAALQGQARTPRAAPLSAWWLGASHGGPWCHWPTSHPPRPTNPEALQRCCVSVRLWCREPTTWHGAAQQADAWRWPTQAGHNEIHESSPTKGTSTLPSFSWESI